MNRLMKLYALYFVLLILLVVLQLIYRPDVKAQVEIESYDMTKVNIVDISHEISKFDIQEAAFIFKNCYKSFPEGTIHVIGVNEELNNDNQHIAIAINNQYIIGPDNGLFSLIFDEIEPQKIVEINITQDTDDLTFATKDIFIKVACHIARGGTLEMIGNIIPDFKNKRSSLNPVIDQNTIKGIVTYIDTYGNAISNIHKDLFKQVGAGRKFYILYGRGNEELKKTDEKYQDVPEGERIALFGTNQLLQISINKGKASELLGLYQFDIIRIEFI